MAVALLAGGARADDACGAPDHPWVQSLSAPGDARRFETLLRTELTARRIDLCPDAGAHTAPPVATVELSRREGAASIVVQVRDAITSKRVERDVDLGAVPTDGQALTLALAADELLRASWAELALKAAPPPAVPVPPAVAETVASSVLPARATPLATLGVAAPIEHYAGGQTLYGVDVQGSFWVTRRIALGARFGLRAAPSVTAPDGEVRASSVLAGVEASITATPTTWVWGCDAVSRFDWERISYLSTPDAGASSSSQAADAFLLGAGARVFWAASRPIRLFAEALADVPLRPVQAADTGAAVVALQGVGLAASLGARAVF